MQIRKPILDRIATLENLPTLPHILLKLIKACDEDKENLKDIAKIIEKDPSLTGKVLRLINSAYYGLPYRIERMDQAVSFLGTDTIKNTVISTSIFQAFDDTQGDVSFNLKRFWWHSLRCAIVARLIAERSSYSKPGEAFLSGLLHDIGRLVLWVNFPKEYSNLLEMYKDKPDLLLAGEVRLGATHCEVGAWLLDRWNLQSFMADSVLCHHEPIDRIRTALPLVKIVYVANALSRMPIAGQKNQGFEVAEDIFGFRDADIEALLVHADRELGEVAQSLEIEIEPPERGDTPFSEKDFGKQEDLVHEVRDISLVMGTLQNLLEADAEDAIVKVVQKGLQILFDVRNIFFLLYDSEKDSLVGKSIPGDEKSAMMSELIIPMQLKHSLLVTSLAKGMPIDSFTCPTRSPSIISDEQIIRFIGKEGMLCLPMIAHGDHVGVIIIGLDHVEFSHISRHFKFLTLFTNQAALALYTEQMKQDRLNAIQSERFGASMAVARKVVHEVNNPLSIIKNYLRILGMKLSENGIAQDEIGIINEEIDRIGLMLQQLTTFSGGTIEKIEPVNVNDLLSDLVKIMKESLMKESKIAIQLDLEPSLPNVMTEKNGLKQVFINLIKNAAEAMHERGNLQILTRHLSDQLESDVVDYNKGFQGYVEITIKDDGPGIPHDIKSRLFEPFVGSKGGGHSGLGLSVVHNIINALNGTISYESDDKRGTSFKIGLPIVRDQKA